MSHFDLTDKRGNSYRLSPGCRIPASDSIATHYAQADVLLYQVDTGQLLQARDHFYGLGHFPLLRYWQQQRLGNSEAPLCPLETLAAALTHHELTIIRVDSKRANFEDKRGILRVKIRQAFAAIIAQERAEAAGHTRRLADEKAANRALIYTGAFFNGLWNAGTDLTKWLKEVNDLISPSQRILRTMHSAHKAATRSTDDSGSILTAFAEEHLKGERRELVEALGFDPSAISSEQLDQAMAVADLIWDDPALRSDITRFARDYVTAQHPVELTNLSGSAAFEVLFTIILAAATAGVGLAVGATSQARHFAKFRKVGTLLLEFAEQVKRARLRFQRSSAKGNRGTSHSFDQLPVDEVDVQTGSRIHPAKKHEKAGLDKKQNSATPTPKTNPEDIRAAAKHWSDEKAFRFKIADEFYDSAGYKDYDSHLRGIDFNEEVEVIEIKKGDKLYQYSYLDRKTGEPRVGSYFYSDTSVDAERLGFDIDGREMIELEVLEDAKVLKSKAANIEDWNGSGKIFPGGETQLFNPNLKLRSPSLVE